MRLGRRRVRIKRADLDAFIASGSSSGQAEHPDGELLSQQTSDAWATFGTALAGANAKLAAPDRGELAAALRFISRATNALARVLGG